MNDPAEDMVSEGGPVMAVETPREECGHPEVDRYTTIEGKARLWACNDCKLRFYPACPQCRVNGHRDERHPEA